MTSRRPLNVNRTTCRKKRSVSVADRIFSFS